MHKEDFMAAIPLVLLPGAGDVRSENHFLVPSLKEAGYRVVNADLPGHGESPLAESYGVAETADALLALIQGLGGGHASVIGTSFAEASCVHSRLHSELVMVEGAGHYPHGERADIVGPAIVDFLNRVTR
jgi:pimeloyl-ACP methyl ester carboxylesterase